jgi:integrase
LNVLPVCDRLSDLTFNKNVVVIDPGVSRTDQEGAVRKAGLPFGKNKNHLSGVGVTSVLRAAHIKQGPVFRRVDRSRRPSRRRGLNRDFIGKMLNRAAARARMKTGPVGGHSLRAGCLTQAAMNGIQEAVIQRQTGHKTVSMLRRYIRLGEIFRENAADGLGIYSRISPPGKIHFRGSGACTEPDSLAGTRNAVHRWRIARGWGPV